MMKNSLDGVYLPLITPFYDGEVDFQSLTGLVDYYIKSGISGLVPLATTGEIPVISREEYFEVLAEIIKAADGRVPVFAGLSGNSTDKMLAKLDMFSEYKLDGLLVTSPYYNLPSQEGIYQHFRRLAESTELDLILYNIPYRTGRNVENETIGKLAVLDNIIGIKDSCGNLKQSLELIRQRPQKFSVLTGEDLFFMSNLTNGGNGAILASAHMYPDLFVDVFKKVRENDIHRAMETWLNISGIIQHLFQEPNPAPIKYCLYKKGLIRSDEVRGPLCRISSELKEILDTISF